MLNTRHGRPKLLRIFPLVIPVLVWVAGCVTPRGASLTTPSGDADYDHMLEFTLAVAYEMMAGDGPFIPFGAAVTEDGVLSGVVVMEPDLSGKQMLDMTLAALSDGAAQGTYRSVAVCLDVLTDVPGRSGKADAIAVVLERRDGTPKSYVVPYRADDNGKTVYEPAFYRAERPLVFK